MALAVLLSAVVLSIAPKPSLHTLRPTPVIARLRTQPLILCESEDSGRAVRGKILDIAAPAFVGLAIDPVASLVDTAFVGRCCGSADLAGTAVAVAIFSLVSKTFNFLGSATTTFVAEASSADAAPGEFSVEMARVAAASVVMALALGTCIALGLLAGGGPLLSRLGLAAGSPMRAPAQRYLALRAASAPAVMAVQALQGAYRGARDSATPLAALGAATVLNIVLDSLLIPPRCLGWGVAGAAIATAASQIFGALWLLRNMQVSCGAACRVDGAAPLPLLALPAPRVADCKKVAKAGGSLTLRTFTGVGALSYSSAAASALGAPVGAGHAIAFQVWLSASLLADAVAVGAQALLAQAVAAADRARARLVARETLRLGLAMGAALTLALAAGGAPIRGLFSSDAAALGAAAAVWPLVVASQPLNAMAFVIDGLLFGARDFNFCAVQVVVASAASVAVMRWAGRGLAGVWLGLGLFMGMRGVLGVARIASRRGPWRVLRE